MSAFSWKETYSVGVEEIDRQHKDWFVSHTSLEDRKIGDHLRQRK